VSSPLSQATARIHDSEPGFGSLAFPERTAGPLLFCKNLKPWRFHTLVRGGSPSSSASGRNRSRGTPRLRLFVRDRDRSRLDSRGLASPPCVATVGSAKLLSWGFPKIASPPVSAPHVRTLFSQESRAVAHPRREDATLRARSALAVPPGFSGFLRATPCRFIAPCNRS